MSADAAYVVSSVLEQDTSKRLMAVLNLATDAATSLRALNLLLVGLMQRKVYDPDVSAALHVSERLLSQQTDIADSLFAEMMKYLPATEVESEPAPAVH